MFDGRLYHLPQVSLLRFFLILQIAAFGFWNVVSREASGREHFFTVLDVRAEQEQCDRLLSLLLPPTIMATVRGVHDIGLASTGGLIRGDEISGAIDVRGVVSASEERFAERFPDVSVLFAEGAIFHWHIVILYVK